MKAASSGKKSPADVCEGVEFRGNTAGFDSILTPEAVAFVAGLHREFNARRRQLLEARKGRQRRLDAGEMPDFLPETANIRESDWQVAPIPADLQDRRVEITGPPRGWHLDECHMLWEGEPVSASLFDFGLFFFHNTKKLVDRGSGPYLRSETSPPFLRGGQGGLDN